MVFACGPTKQGTRYANTFNYEVKAMMDTVTASIEGKIIIVPERIAVPDATLKLSSNADKFTSISLKNGTFLFSHIPAGKYEIRTDYPGLYSFRDSIQVDSGQIISMLVGMGYDE